MSEFLFLGNTLLLEFFLIILKTDFHNLQLLTLLSLSKYGEIKYIMKEEFLFWYFQFKLTNIQDTLLMIYFTGNMISGVLSLTVFSIRRNLLINGSSMQ